MADKIKQTKKELIKQGQKAIKTLDKQTKKTASKAAKEKAKRPPTRVTAARKLQSKQESFLSLPLIWKVLVALIVYRWIKNSREQDQWKKDYNDALRFLRESRGFRA